MRAAAFFARGLDVTRALGHGWGTAILLTNLGLARLRLGQVAAAAALLEESLALAHASGNDEAVEGALHNLANVRSAQGDDTRAAALFAEALSLQQALGVVTNAPLTLEDVAVWLGKRGYARDAVRLAAAAAALRATSALPLPADEREEQDPLLAAARRRLGDASFAAAWAEGQALSLDHAIAAARDLCAGFQGSPPLLGEARAP